MTSKDDYEVGYGRPPKNHQFPKGRSGNPTGRPKGSKNLKTDIKEVLDEKVRVTTGEGAETVSKQRAMVLRASEKAMKGDPRSLELIFKYKAQCEADDYMPPPEMPLSEEEETILHDFLDQRSPAIKSTEELP